MNIQIDLRTPEFRKTGITSRKNRYRLILLVVILLMLLFLYVTCIYKNTPMRQIVNLEIYHSQLDLKFDLVFIELSLSNLSSTD